MSGPSWSEVWLLDAATSMVLPLPRAKPTSKDDITSSWTSTNYPVIPKIVSFNPSPIPSRCLISIQDYADLRPIILLLPADANPPSPKGRSSPTEPTPLSLPQSPMSERDESRTNPLVEQNLHRFVPPSPVSIFRKPKNHPRHVPLHRIQIDDVLWVIFRKFLDSYGDERILDLLRLPPRVEISFVVHPPLHRVSSSESYFPRMILVSTPESVNRA